MNTQIDNQMPSKKIKGVLFSPMITLERAQAIAKGIAYLPYPSNEGGETDDCWIFAFSVPPGPDGNFPPGYYQFVRVDKADGKVAEMQMPSHEGIALLKRSKPVKLSWS